MDHLPDLPDAVVAEIMRFAHYGSASGELTCPAARFASVSKKWKKIYSYTHSKKLFVTNELKRIPSWTIGEDLSDNPPGAGRVETITDSYDPSSRRPRLSWWTSSYIFSMGGRNITRNPAEDAAGGPFHLLSGHQAPLLRVSFARPVSLRAIAIAARNRPRMVLLIAKPHGFEQLLAIPPPSPFDRPESGLSFVPIENPSYMDLVASFLPQGTPPSEEVLSYNSALPVVLPEPMSCECGLDIHILQSHERGWVGINRLALFE